VTSLCRHLSPTSIAQQHRKIKLSHDYRRRRDSTRQSTQTQIYMYNDAQNPPKMAVSILSSLCNNNCVNLTSSSALYASFHQLATHGLMPISGMPNTPTSRAPFLHHHHHHHHGEDGSRPERPLYPRNRRKITNTCYEIGYYIVNYGFRCHRDQCYNHKVLSDQTRTYLDGS